MDRVVAEQVVPYLADKRHVTPKSLGGDGLVRSLAAGSHTELPAENGLSGLRMSLREHGHVGVAAPDDQYLTLFHIAMVSCFSMVSRSLA